MPLSLASVFTSHMVLQQSIPVPVWGTATPGTRVVVSFPAQERNADDVADKDGRWAVMLKPLAASAEPAELTVTGSLNGAHSSVKISDVLVGEVWVCSGQSNMEWPLSLCDHPDKEIAGANFPKIRLFTVPKVATGAAVREVTNAAWLECTPANIPAFSGVGYFFGREIHQCLGVPVGLINSSWGGTVAEAWVSRKGLISAPPIVKELIERYETDLPSMAVAGERYKKELAELDARIGDDANPKNPGFLKGWADLADPTQGGWLNMELPGAWQSKGLNHSGILWFRKVVDVPAGWAGKDLQLSIGATDKSDVTYFNNHVVGSITMKQRADSWSTARNYTVPGNLVKAGRNVIAVRVHSEKYHGGMTGPAELMHLSCPQVPGHSIKLPGVWSYAIEANYGLVNPPPPPMGPDNPNSPTNLFNGMISPLQPMAIRGAIWYQGESNVGRAKQYRHLLPTLIKDWSRGFANDDLAFHIVQLTNFMAVQENPGESGWAELREAQSNTLKVPHTGLAVAIDIGDAADIHPRNKQDVGLRLALYALNTTYGKKDVIPSGPQYKTAKTEGSAIRISFDFVGGGLVAKGGPLKGFAIAGADKMYVWANATIDGDSVIVSSPSVKEPKAVRYAWADNPICNLYNSARLPAVPFRTDPD